MKHSSIFKSRWMALIWAAGIIWFALDVAGPAAKPSADGNAEASADGPTDVTGHTITTDDEEKMANIIQSL